MRVLVTRPEHQSASFVQLLNQAGHIALPVPLSEIVPLQEAAQQQAIRQQLMELDNFSKVIVVSANAAQLGAEAIDMFWPQWPQGIEWFAVGNKTSQVLESWGQRVTVPKIMSSEGLMQLPELFSPVGEKVLLLCGQGGRELLETTLTERGAQVTRCELYFRQPPVSAELNLQTMFTEQGLPDVITVTSGEILSVLSQCCANIFSKEQNHHLLSESQAQYAQAWLSIPLIVPSERVAAKAAELGWKRMIVASSAMDQDFLIALNSLETKD